MRRYVTIPNFRRRQRAEYIPDFGEEYLHLPAFAVYEDDDLQETGLIDKRGNTLYRVKERGKLGF